MNTAISPLVDPDRLAQVTRLAHGKHSDIAAGMCALEAASFIAGEPFSDHPECVCPVIAAFLRKWNDRLPDDRRTANILPLLPKIIGSRVSRVAQARRAYACADGAVRVFAPAALRACGMKAAAEELEALPEIVDATTASRARKAAAAADAAYAAAYAADAAAYAADAAAAAAYAADAAYAAAYAADAAAAADAEIDAKAVALVERLLAIGDVAEAA